MTGLFSKYGFQCFFILCHLVLGNKSLDRAGKPTAMDAAGPFFSEDPAAQHQRQRDLLFFRSSVAIEILKEGL